MKLKSAKKKGSRNRGYKKAVRLGRSPRTGLWVLKPVGKGASITVSQVRHALRQIKGAHVD